MPSHFEAQGEVIVLMVFESLWNYKTEEDDEENNEKLLPKVNVGEVLSYKKLQLPKNSLNPARYTEAALVRKLEELGIGRPSTYAPTIQTIQNRGYVDKEKFFHKKGNCKTFSGKIWTEKEVLTEKFGGDKNKFVPTDIGEVVNEF